MPLEPVSYSAQRSLEPRVTLDKHKRLALNKAARRLLGVDGIKAYLYVSYDTDTQRIGIGKVDVLKLADVNPHRIDLKGYVPARELIARYNIDVSKSMVFEYDGQVAAPNRGHWQTFKFSKFLDGAGGE